MKGNGWLGVALGGVPLGSHESQSLAPRLPTMLWRASTNPRGAVAPGSPHFRRSRGSHDEEMACFRVRGTSKVKPKKPRRKWIIRPKYIHVQENVSLLVYFRECFAFNRKLPAECQLLADVHSFLSQNMLPCNKNHPAEKKSRSTDHMMFCTPSNHPDIHQISICQKTDNCFFWTKTTWIWPAKAIKKTFAGSLGLWKSMSPSYLKNHLQRWTLTWFGPSSTQVPHIYIYLDLVLIYLYTCV